jgi:hypothetical protein
MQGFFRSFSAERLKLRRSPALKLIIFLPLLFLFVEFLVFERPLLAFPVLPPQIATLADTLQLKMLVGLWGGFFHPLLVSLLPALLFRPEHRFKTWRHLHAQPVSRQGMFLAKAAWAFLIIGVILAALGLLLILERRVLGWVHPPLALPLHGLKMGHILGWFWLTSLPVVALTLWICDRINSLAVPVVFGLIGLLLTMALTGQEMPQPWRRDLIPWVLPYAAAEQVMRSETVQQEAHMAAALFQPEPDVLRLPSGKKIRTRQNIPDHLLFPPPPPTPAWTMATFSLIAGLGLLGLGLFDTKRDRT